MAGNTNFDQILSTTLNNYIPKLQDNIFKARPLFYALTNGQTIRRVSGGAKIITPVMYAGNPSAGSYSGTDTLSVVPSAGISAAEYEWKQYAATVTISGIEEGKNNGEAQIIDLLEGKIWQTQQTITDNLNAMLYKSGAGNGGKDWLGLEKIVNGSALTANKLGGIDPSVAGNEFWKANETAGIGALTLAKMSAMYNDCSVGNDQPTIIITSQKNYETYEGLLTNQVRYTDTDMASGGFQNLMFKGCPVTFDGVLSDLTHFDPVHTGRMYFLNTKYLQLVAHSDTWFKATPFVRPHTLDSVYSQILCYGELTCTARNRQGVMLAIT